MSDKFYLTTITVRVLSDRPYSGHEELDDIARAIDSGDEMGEVEFGESKELTPKECYETECELGGDGTFMQEDGWKYGLHNGDEVRFDKGDNVDPSPCVQICEIEYVGENHEAFRILTTDGERIEGLVSEIC